MYAFACCSASAGTVCGTSPEVAGEWNAVDAPPNSCSTTSSQTSACPETSSKPITSWIAQFAESEPIRTSFRGRRSPKTPPASSAAICASVRAPSTSPRSVALPRSSTAKASATGTTFVPKKEIARPANRSRKLRWRSAAMRSRLRLGRASFQRFPVALQTLVGLPERHRAVVFLGLLGRQIGLARRDELLLGGTFLDPPSPRVEPLAQLAEMPADVVREAEVDQ